MQALNGQSTILALTNFSTPKKHCPSEQDLHIIDSGKKKKQRFVELAPCSLVSNAILLLESHSVMV